MARGISRRKLLGMIGGVPAAAVVQTRTSADLTDAIEAMSIADVHGHAFPALTPVTERIFLEELSMSAWQMDAYFPQTYRQWKSATGDERARLDREFGIGKRQLLGITFVEIYLDTGQLSVLARGLEELRS